jgi:hypothetical protein
LFSSAHLATDDEVERGWELKGYWGSIPNGSYFASSLASLPDGLASNSALWPSKADFIEVQVRMICADVMKNSHHSASNPVTESFCTIHVHDASDKVLLAMADYVMGDKAKSTVKRPR